MHFYSLFSSIPIYCLLVSSSDEDGGGAVFPAAKGNISILCLGGRDELAELQRKGSP